MKRTARFALILTTACGLVFAQSPSGGWRRAGDPPSATAVPDSPDMAAQDPTQPVARVDEYGQALPASNQQQSTGQRYSPPPYGLPPQVTIPAGTFVTMRVNQMLSSDHNQQGDIFSGSLVQPVVVDGIVVAQRGQTVMGRVMEAVKAGMIKGTSRLALQVTGITLADGVQMNVQSQLVNRNGPTDVGRDVGAIATTTAVGASIGAVADWGTGAAIGAGAGAAAGLIGVLLTRGHPTEVYPETVLTFRIDTPVRVDIARAPQAYRYIGPNEYDHPIETQLAQRPPAPRPAGGWYGPAVYPYPWGYPYGWGWGPYYGGVGVGVVVHGGHGYYGGPYRRYGRH